MKPVGVTNNTYIDFGKEVNDKDPKEVNDKDPKFQVDNHVRISKFKNIFAKGCTPNWSEEDFLFSKIKNTVPWTYVIICYYILMVKELLEHFREKNCKKQIKKNLG